MLLKHHMISLFWRLFFRPYARVTRGMTLGSRVMVLDADNRVLLVKQSYSPNWILPGGGVERGETLLQGGLRELREETGVVALGEAQFLGVFSNHSVFPGDHVACFVLRDFERLAWQPDGEITAAEFFARDSLPDAINKGSLQRIREVLDHAAVSHFWSEP
jgi:8-oxo-dGTP pyrophosphatase MutT (NUDIX family)